MQAKPSDPQVLGATSIPSPEGDQMRQAFRPLIKPELGKRFRGNRRLYTFGALRVQVEPEIRVKPSIVGPVVVQGEG